MDHSFFCPDLLVLLQEYGFRVLALECLHSVFQPDCLVLLLFPDVAIPDYPEIPEFLYGVDYPDHFGYLDLVGLFDFLPFLFAFLTGYK
jgi:hypothetical protein